MCHLQFPERCFHGFSLVMMRKPPPQTGGRDHTKLNATVTAHKRARQPRANGLLKWTCAKKPHGHIPITSPVSAEAFIINRGNHGGLLIGDALVGVSKVSGVLSLSICKLPQLGENRRDVTLSCLPPVDCEGCNLNPSFSSQHRL